MNKSWKDPDTGVVHAIGVVGRKSTAWEHAHEIPGLMELPLDAIGRRFFRLVTMCCGASVRLDSDDFISPAGTPMTPTPSPILRPWITGHEAPTCVICASDKPPDPMQNLWGVRGSLRGA